MAQSSVGFLASAIRPQFNPRKKTQVRIRTWVYPFAHVAELFFGFGIKKEIYIWQLCCHITGETFRVFSTGVSLEIFLRLFPSKRASSNFWIPPFHVVL